MTRTTTFITFALTLVLPLAAGCTPEQLQLLDESDESGESSDGGFDGEDSPEGIAEAELPPAPASCGFAWESALEPGVPDVLGVGPMAIAGQEDGGFLVYGHTLQGFSSYIWIGSFDAAGTLGEVVQLDPGATPDSEIWSTDTDGAGNLVVFAKLVENPGDEPTPVLARFEPDGTETWRRGLPADIEAELDEVGIAASPSGEVAVSATRRVSNEDTDVWVARLDPASGEIVWETSFSGPVNGGWSLDHGGPLAIGDDGWVFALGRLRQDYQTVEATLVAFDGADPAPLWSAVPIADPGAQQEQWGAVVEIGEDETVYASVNVDAATGMRTQTAAYFVGELLWSSSTDELDWNDGADFLVRAIAPDGAGGASLVGEFARGGTNLDAGTFLVEIDATGTRGCKSQWLGEGGVFHAVGVARAQDGSLLMAGSSGPTEYVSGPGWLGAYAF